MMTPSPLACHKHEERIWLRPTAHCLAHRRCSVSGFGVRVRAEGGATPFCELGEAGTDASSPHRASGGPWLALLARAGELGKHR